MIRPCSVARFSAARRHATCRLAAAIAAPACLAALPVRADADTAFRVRFEAPVREQPATGRLVVYLIKDGARARAVTPADAPFFDNPQPMFGVDVKDLKPGDWVTLDVASLAPDGPSKEARPRSFPGPIAELPPGDYRVQAVLDLNRENSSWRREPGNLYSAVYTFNVHADRARTTPMDIPLSKAVTAEETKPHAVPGVEYFEVRSDLLSRFRGKDVLLRAGIVPPVEYDRTRPGRYAAVYEVPGFGGDHEDAAGHASRRGRAAGASPGSVLNRSVFWIVLDPEGPNGHHLFVDSANNGPVGEALITELIPALEKKYNLAAVPAARLLRGHSSGGWSTLWLATRYPDTFGATWSTSPDPVDFRRFQLVDLYKDLNAYERGGVPIPSYRAQGSVKMTISQENAMEDVLGPDNTSAQQWDSWFAAFGPRSVRGTPAPVWDAASGVIDHVVAEQFKPFDIGERLRRDPAKLGPIFKQRVRLIVGDQDNYYLNEAVELLRAEVDRLNFISLPEGSSGSITIVPGKDHGTIFMTRPMQAIADEMVEHLKRHQFAK